MQRLQEYCSEQEICDLHPFTLQLQYYSLQQSMSYDVNNTPDMKPQMIADGINVKDVRHTQRNAVI